MSCFQKPSFTETVQLNYLEKEDHARFEEEELEMEMERERGASFGTQNDGDLHFAPSQCPGIQKPHQRSPFPILAMGGMESPPLNSPWGLSVSTANTSVALETDVQAQNMTVIEFLDILVNVAQCQSYLIQKKKVACT